MTSLSSSRRSDEMPARFKAADGTIGRDDHHTQLAEHLAAALQSEQSVYELLAARKCSARLVRLCGAFRKAALLLRMALETELTDGHPKALYPPLSNDGVEATGERAN